MKKGKQILRSLLYKMAFLKLVALPSILTFGLKSHENEKSTRDNYSTLNKKNSPNAADTRTDIASLYYVLVKPCRFTFRLLQLPLNEIVTVRQ